MSRKLPHQYDGLSAVRTMTCVPWSWTSLPASRSNARSVRKASEVTSMGRP